MYHSLSTIKNSHLFWSNRKKTEKFKFYIENGGYGHSRFGQNLLTELVFLRTYTKKITHLDSTVSQVHFVTSVYTFILLDESCRPERPAGSGTCSTICFNKVNEQCQPVQPRRHCLHRAIQRETGDTNNWI